MDHGVLAALVDYLHVYRVQLANEAALLIAGPSGRCGSDPLNRAMDGIVVGTHCREFAGRCTDFSVVHDAIAADSEVDVL